MELKLGPVKLKPVVAAFLVVWLTVLSLGSTAVMAADSTYPSNTLGLNVKAAILIDADTGQVLYAVNADEPRPPASMTKMMTEYMVLEAISKKEITWDTQVTVSEEAASTPADGSQVYLAQGDVHTVKELYTAMAVASANDATIALASFLGGSEQGFVAKMNEKAKEMGLKTAVFTSATGLLDTTLMSASDVAKMARMILQQHPEFLDYSSIPSQKFRARDTHPMINNDWMLANNKGIPAFKPYVYDGVDGMKTGYLGAAGYCFTGTVKQGDTRLISVVMGTRSKGARFTETAKLYNYAFQSLEKKTAVQAKSVVKTVESVKLSKGVSTSVPVVTESDMSLMVKKGATPDVTLVASKVPASGELVAPVKQGQKLGTVTYRYKDAETGATMDKTVNLIAAEDVDKASWWRLMFRGIKDFIVSLFNGIVNLF
nr:D-alanyl-D-alanine carboxypeptidase family protein [Paenibacillus beijingensis]